MRSLSLLSRRLSGLLGLTLALAGCQGARSAYQFQPAAVAASTTVAQPPADLLSASPAATPPGTMPVAEGLPAAASPVAPLGAGINLKKRSLQQLATRPRLARRVTKLLARASNAKAAARSAVSTSDNALLKERLRRFAGLLHPRPAQHEATVENGLGSTVVGILGILALLVGLVGLIFAGWGFFGWLAIAGAVGLLISILEPYVMGYA